VHGRAQPIFVLINSTHPNAWRVFTAVHNRRVLFTWELRDKARSKRWFYVNLKRVLGDLPPKSWEKVGGSVYLVDERHSRDVRELLKQFGSQELKWREFKIE
jgi:hypothetical protein